MLSVFLRFTDSDYPFWYLQTLLSYPIEFEIKDTTYAASSVSYRDLHHEIDSKCRLRTKLYDKRDDFNFLIVNFPFIFSNIPAAHAYGVDINYMKELNQEFLMNRLKSSIQRFTVTTMTWLTVTVFRYHNLVLS